MPTADVSPNLLIISDLHLGEDIKDNTSAKKTGFIKHLVIVERELETFLTHYARFRLDGRPWRLVVNGDMVDFLSICLLPRSDEPRQDMPEDAVYGLGARPHAACAKMRRVFERHPGVFRALARFVGSGNELKIVAGNHDVEFHWPIVQDTLRKGIAALWRDELASRRPGAMSMDAVEAAVTFHPWFYFEEDVVWVEHGHQYDDYCSFNYILNPVASKDDEIVMTVGAAGIRYVTNQLGGGSQQEDWSAWGYISWAFANGASGIWKFARSYAAMSSRLISGWRRFSRSAVLLEERRRAHLERLRGLAAQFKLSEESLSALDNLRRRPVVQNLFRLLMALMLDRVLLVIAAMLLILGGVLALPWGWAIGGAVGVVLLTSLASRYLERTREAVDPGCKLEKVPEHILEHVRAPFVVFGHSHNPVAVRLENGGWYFNTGTWVASEKPGLLRAFTHLLIRHAAGGPVAALCQWREGQSHAFVRKPG